MGEDGRIPGVAVKCVEIWRNTDGERAAIWPNTDAEVRKHGGANRIRYPGSPCRKRCLLAVGAFEALVAQLTR